MGAEAIDVGVGLRRVSFASSVMLERLCRGCRGDGCRVGATTCNRCVECHVGAAVSWVPRRCP